MKGRRIGALRAIVLDDSFNLAEISSGSEGSSHDLFDTFRSGKRQFFDRLRSASVARDNQNMLHSNPPAPRQGPQLQRADAPGQPESSATASNRAPGAAHRTRRERRASKYIGVSRHNHPKKWRASLYYNGKARHINYFDTELEAAYAYDEAAIMHRPDAQLNFVCKKSGDPQQCLCPCSNCRDAAEAISSKD